MSTFTKVIVGDDGQSGGADALALARALAPEAEVILASAYPWEPTPGRFQQPAYSALLRDDTIAALERRREEAGLPEAETVALGDASPARGLHRLAESEGADLIVVGSARHGAVGRLLLGSVGRAVLHGSPCPVAVAPRDYAANPAAVATVGVAFDHSAEARHALDVALGIARDRGAALALRQVVAADLLPAVAGYPMINVEQLSGELRDAAQKRLDELVPTLEADGVPITAQAVLGTSAAERLEELAGQVDLLVTGSRGYGALRRVVLGSTADRLIHRAGCPVLVVPRTAEETDHEASVQDSERAGEDERDVPVSPG
jgi:nucleotide-binding universal stress UspA family protein